MTFGRPLGHSWFGYVLILCVLCICLTWFSSCWIILIKQNFNHSLKNTVRCDNLNFRYYYYYYCYYYYYYYYCCCCSCCCRCCCFLHIKEIQSLFFALLDRFIRLDLEEGWYILPLSSSLSVKSKINVNLSNKCTCQISQHTAKNITKLIKITSNIGHNDKS